MTLSSARAIFEEVSKKFCVRCSKHGHEAAPDAMTCSRSYQAARAVALRGLSVREAAEKFGVLPTTVNEDLRMFPEARERSSRRSLKTRPRGRRRDVVALRMRTAANAVALRGLSVRDAARIYEVTSGALRRAVRRCYR